MLREDHSVRLKDQIVNKMYKLLQTSEMDEEDVLKIMYENDV